MDNSINSLGTVGGKNQIRIPFLVTVIASVIVVLAFFLPLASANEKHKEYLENYEWEIDAGGLEMSSKDAVHMSMFDYARIYWGVVDTIDRTLATVVTAVIAASGILSLVTLAFALWKKPIAVILFNGLTLGAYYLMTWDFNDRGVLPNSHYEWGIAYYLYYIGIAAIFAGAVWMLVTKIKIKQKNKEGNNVFEQ